MSGNSAASANDDPAAMLAAGPLHHQLSPLPVSYYCCYRRISWAKNWPGVLLITRKDKGESQVRHHKRILRCFTQHRMDVPVFVCYAQGTVLLAVVFVDNFLCGGVCDAWLSRIVGIGETALSSSTIVSTASSFSTTCLSCSLGSFSASWRLSRLTSLTRLLKQNPSTRITIVQNIRMTTNAK